jgi:pSer/pThr/pTyr-binding forkhead associated (FHA) protein
MVSQERQKIRHLLIIKDRKGKRAIPLTMDTYSLGRAVDNTIVLYGSSVSRQHAIITRLINPNNKLAPFQIVDGNFQGIKSTNGLLVNEKKCENHNLQHGDFIEFGNAVKVTYYTLFNLLDREFEQFCETENNSETIKQSVLASQAITYTTQIPIDRDRQTLIHLASFPELIPHPIIEIDLAGSIAYCNQIAIQEFPQLQKLKEKHPIIVGLPELVRNTESSHLIREITHKQRIFEQSIQYFDEERKIIILTIDITTRQAKLISQIYSDRFLQEVVVPDLNFESRMQSLLKLGCECFNLEVGFIGKLEEKSLQIAKIFQTLEEEQFLAKDRNWEISEASEDRSLRLFQFTVNHGEPVTLQHFSKFDDRRILPAQKTLIINRIPISSYLGIKLVVNQKTYGILSFLSSNNKIAAFSDEQISFLQTMSQWLVREIERRQLEIVLKNLLKQKNYSQQLIQEISQPINELVEITQQLVDSNLDLSQHSLAEELNHKSENLLWLIQNIAKSANI